MAKAPKSRESRAGAMDENLFWSLIATLDWKQTGDDDAVVEPVVAALAGMHEADIFRFDDILAEKLHALDGEKYARNIGMDAYKDGKYFSVDMFLYARACTVANGRKAFETALANPKKMIKNKDFEALLYVAQQAYERKTGGEYTHIPEPNYETYANKSGWE
jgi:hypothetical protein